MRSTEAWSIQENNNLIRINMKKFKTTDVVFIKDNTPWEEINLTVQLQGEFPDRPSKAYTRLRRDGWRKAGKREAAAICRANSNISRYDMTLDTSVVSRAATMKKIWDYTMRRLQFPWEL